MGFPDSGPGVRAGGTIRRRNPPFHRLRPDSGLGTPVSRHPEEFLAFFRQCVERYGRKVRYIEVFNEPNLLRFWQEPPNPEAYAELLKRRRRWCAAVLPA
ncbi:MAG: hypothetical protein L6W00_15645 [Lentisphaeria bacterium]|nr:MAG: hypothetical protein L6W00_15645 [Lentisphaeria bacterium]